ncbi:peptidoglycan-binding protein [Actinoplanes cyaneus]|uniref:Peptidoglycan-binding protein n=1 Tax=Actinoplanes cyaneus TaxID=52696 RepID=A0A919IEX6_9ACTN|nr:peptidoglycan-binding protein [Actinoplanes cyaneus]MCW2136315.1 Multidrug efflux pump subunit AcrA (membrane-fusion protein) [Actinoplanes cyaneus]GID64539.1 peptidoglycan-binding protein [Actinoplanes cyaneus]
MSRKWTTAAVAGVLVAGGVTAYLLIGGLPEAEKPAQAGAGNLPAATADVTRTTLVDKESHDGTLGYGDTGTLATRLSGTVTWMPATGATIKRGKPLYKVDSEPVILMYGTLPAYRALSSGSKGTDVNQLEKNLWALGYRGFTVDSTFTSATADAVQEWQEDLGLDETGTVDLGRVVFEPGAVRIDSRTVEPGATAQPGTEMLQTSDIGRVATVTLDVADQRLARKGAKVDVTLPDGSTVPAKISGVETTVEESDDPNGEDETKISVTIGFTRAPAGLDEAAVTVLFVASQRENVLTVPVNALLALSEGGYGLQVVDGATTEVVAVETGLFADGRVEVSGGDLAEGTKVGVPA